MQELIALRTCALCLLMAIAVMGCGYLRRHQAPTIVDTPEQFLSAPTAMFVDEPWWPVFQDTTLSRLIEQAFVTSPTMDIAVARLEQLQAVNRYAASTMFPSVSTSGSVQTGDQQVIERYNDGFREYSVRANTVYEIDFWKKLSSGRRRATAELVASRYDAATSVLALTSQIARTYYTVIRLREELKALKRAETSYQIDSTAVSNLYLLKKATSLDVFQTQAVLAQTRALAELISVSIRTEEHSLSILLGYYPRASLDTALDTLPDASDVVGAGLPSELLARRPDVQAARARLAAADFAWAEAYAERFPSFSLTAIGGNVSHELKDALDPGKMTINLASRLTLPIFEGGRLRAQSDAAGTVYRQMSAEYEATVLNAFREVEDALVLAEHETAAIKQLEIATVAADSALQIARTQYLEGIVTHLTVLYAQNAQLDAERNLINARFDLITYRIDLATALGGSWTEVAIENFTRTQLPVPVEK